MRSVSTISAERCRGCCYRSQFVISTRHYRVNTGLYQGAQGLGWPTLAQKRSRSWGRCEEKLRVSASSVSERYNAAEEGDPIKPLRHPAAAWHRWWYIGATPQAELPPSQKFSRICNRLWSIIKHSKTSLTFAVMFMVI